VGISEFYVMPKAKLRFITVHNWNRAAHVRPGTGVLVGEGGEYVEYYANLVAVKTLQTNPRVWLGDAAKAHTTSILLGLEDAEIDVGTTALLEDNGAVAELATRAIATDNAVITMRVLVEASAPLRAMWRATASSCRPTPTSRQYRN
jgi:Fe-S cluster assembly scaffold protein SufB